VAKAIVSYSIIHDAKGKSEMKLDRMVAHLVVANGKFTA
jgi:hypothetical protein